MTPDPFSLLGQLRAAAAGAAPLEDQILGILEAADEPMEVSSIRAHLPIAAIEHQALRELLDRMKKEGKVIAHRRISGRRCLPNLFVLAGREAEFADKLADDDAQCCVSVAAARAEAVFPALLAAGSAGARRSELWAAHPSWKESQLDAAIRLLVEQGRAYRGEGRRIYAAAAATVCADAVTGPSMATNETRTGEAA